ncbi:unnamed protein product [Toxocara canis]|uniref:Uncharacterized protein n=1 Tax=Toxocara canis TaxID=6265 RepID=A0A183VEM2_TOXCA|nr:unnamed protein product [Toxocara canis]
MYRSLLRCALEGHDTSMCRLVVSPRKFIGGAFRIDSQTRVAAVFFLSNVPSMGRSVGLQSSSANQTDISPGLPPLPHLQR